MTPRTVFAEVPPPVNVPVRPVPARFRAPEGRPFVVGHRGSPRLHPENSWDGIRAALHDGADGVEFDVRLAGDGVPVVCHDADLRRTHREHVPLASLPAALLPVPTLASVMTALAEHFPARFVDIELKEFIPPHQLAELLDQAGWRGPTAVTAFEVSTVRAYAEAGGWSVGLLDDDRRLSPEDAVSLLEMTGASFLGIKNPVFLKSMARALHDNGNGLWLWTLNRAAHVRRAMRLGADVVISDLPGRAAAVVQGRDTGDGDSAGGFSRAAP